MRQKLFIFAFLISVISYSQNWNVFNKGYRYNYKYNYSQLISNVLFVESSVVLTSSDTNYTMNKIGVVSGNVLTRNQPQFLQHTIVKKADGSVKFQSPGDITILPTCTLNQTWLYDSNLNYSATCIAISTLNVFSMVDSVRTIIVNNADSVLLSKKFGILMYPFNYGQNLYYRLVGIENKATYDLNALYGEKVPNAWDFYDFYVGYQWCYESNWHNGAPIGSQIQGCEIATQVIKTKSLTPTGYIYNIDKTFKPGPSYGGCTYTHVPATFTNTNLDYSANFCFPSGLNCPILDENKMYPGMVMGSDPVHIVKLGTDNLGRVYKYAGQSCSSMGVTMPNQNEPAGYSPAGPPNTYTVGTMLHSFSFGVGRGKLTANLDCLCSYRYCTNCSGTVGMLDFEKKETAPLIFPNPANTKLNLQLNERSSVKVYNSLGALVKEEFVESKNALDLSNLPNGLYFFEIQTDSFKTTQKLIIEH
jgi:hypothetical protein